MRTAGVYAMARLADDWLDQRQTYINVLCGYLRMPWFSEKDASETAEEFEREVRRTILDVISDHVSKYAAVSPGLIMYSNSMAPLYRALNSNLLNLIGSQYEGLPHLWYGEDV